MKTNLLVNKILYHDKQSAYIVFEGVVLRWSKRKNQFVSTKEKNIYLGYFYCLFLGDRVEADVSPSFSKTYGTQYMITVGKRIEPASEAEIRNFLSSNIKGMTPKRLERLMDTYGLSVLDNIKRNPNALDFLGLDSRITKELYEQLSQNAHFEETIVFLESMDIDCRLANPLFQKYGRDTVFFLKDNPYTAYLDNILDFYIADKIYAHLNKQMNSSLRCFYLTLEALRSDSRVGGNVFSQKETILATVNRFASMCSSTNTGENSFEMASIEASLNDLEAKSLVVLDSSDNQEFVYLKENYTAEKETVKCLKQIIREPKRFFYGKQDIETFIGGYERKTGIHLAENQKEAVALALTSPVSIISGGPGTGKTQTVNTIVTAIKVMTPGATIRACAPTGKAAMRLAELTGLKTSTIHRMIGYGQFNALLQHGEMLCDFLFVDEFSMVDIHLCSMLFDAVSPTARIIMIGDSNQLPSVGPGLVLRDFIESKMIPTVFLTKIFRQALNSNIVVNAHRVISQKNDQPISLRCSRKPGRDFYYIEEDDPLKIEQLIRRSVTKLQNVYHMGTDAVQVLSPVHGGNLGTDHLNVILQNQLNPSSVTIEYEDKEFRLGDKVIHTVNDYDLEVFNGEIGTITDVAFAKDHALTVAYPDRDVSYAYKDLKELELAYALTIHKMQGSEQPVIILPVHEMLLYGLNKHSIYTALTRAKNMVILIGSAKSLSIGLRKEQMTSRNSNLKIRLQK